MHKEHYIQRLNQGNIADVEQLHAVVYGKKPPRNYFQNKYNTTYTGVEYVGFIAYSANQNLPVAYYGVIPCYLQYKNQVALAAQSADTMTHPRHRNKGLFVALANQTYQLCRELGIRLLFGFPNQNSVYGFINKLNWQTNQNLNCFVIPVNALPAESWANKNILLKKVYQCYAGRVLNKHLQPSKLITSLTEAEGGLNRDGAYLQYKTYTKTYFIRCGPADIWFKINNGLVIGDMQLNGADFDPVISQLKKLSGKLGLKQIIFQSSPGTQLSTLFKKRFEAIPTFPIIFMDLNWGLPMDDFKFTFADIDIF